MSAEAFRPAPPHPDCLAQLTAARCRPGGPVTPPPTPTPPVVPDQTLAPSATREAHREAVAAFRADRWQDGCDALEGVSPLSDRRALTDYLEALCDARLGRIGTAEKRALRAILTPAHPPPLAEAHREGVRRLLAWIAAIQDAMLHEAENRLGTLPPIPNRPSRQPGPSYSQVVYSDTRAKLPPAPLDARLQWDALFEGLNRGRLEFIFKDFEDFPFPPPPREVLPADGEL